MCWQGGKVRRGPVSDPFPLFAVGRGQRLSPLFPRQSSWTRWSDQRRLPVPRHSLITLQAARPDAAAFCIRPWWFAFLTPPSQLIGCYSSLTSSFLFVIEFLQYNRHWRGNDATGCGMYPSDVWDSGQEAGSKCFAALHTVPGFDLIGLEVVFKELSLRCSILPGDGFHHSSLGSSFNRWIRQSVLVCLTSWLSKKLNAIYLFFKRY